ncbi:unnamed protein product [Cuscuta campestris]|uniref:Uncharacterized protein n=1 Tax=Cuscuta campestris TaxID=132261 RepID=A0A484KFY8_9ASTE|nr:unnamed protein product [Cuscuta campestris]
MRMKTRRAAMKEYLRAAAKIANEMRNSCHRICRLAHASTPVNATAAKFSGSGSSSSDHLTFNLARTSRFSALFLSALLASPPPLLPAAIRDLWRNSWRDLNPWKGILLVDGRFEMDAAGSGSAGGMRVENDAKATIGFAFLSVLAGDD